MNVDLLIKENKELSEEKQRYKEMWFTANNSLAKYRKLENTFKLIEEMYKKPVCWKITDKEVATYNYTDSTILYNPKTNEIEIYEYDYGYKFEACYKIEEYGITWWLKKDKNE